MFCAPVGSAVPVAAMATSRFSQVYAATGCAGVTPETRAAGAQPPAGWCNRGATAAAAAWEAHCIECEHGRQERKG